jgi:hypothetical protein
MSHNTAEKRRRDKINESIEELRQMVPSTEEEARKATNKAAILKRSVEYLKDLEMMYQRLLQEHHALCAENENLKQLRGSVQALLASETSAHPPAEPRIPLATPLTVGNQPKPPVPFHPFPQTFPGLTPYPGVCKRYFETLQLSYVPNLAILHLWD